MRKKAILCALLLAPLLAFGQTDTSTVNRERPRSSYDPGATAGTKGSPQSGVAAALQKINPQNKNYGQVIDDGKIAAIDETIESFYWWSCMVLTGLLIVAVAYIMWLWRERQIRLNISGDVVAQLYNSYIASRAKALETIEIHNKLARRYNAQSAEIARSKQISEQSEEKANRKSETVLVQNINSDGDEDTANSPQSEDVADSAAAKRTKKTDVQLAPAEQTGSDLAALVRTLQAQITAKDQKISNLRMQVNRAHSSLTEEREGNSARPS